MIFHIMTRLKLANFNGLPQAQVFLKHKKWPPIYRRVQVPTTTCSILTLIYYLQLRVKNSSEFALKAAL